MTDEDLKARLLGPRAQTTSGMSEDDVEVPGLGTVRVRGLSRFEILVARKATDNEANIDGPRALMLERKMVAAAMVDPPMTEAEVGTWQKVGSANEIGVVVDKIRELSGLDEGAPKEAYKSVRDE